MMENALAAPPLPTLDSRRSVAAFWIGVVSVTIGVLLHLPMFWMARDMGFHLAGMPMDNGMIAGMGLIVGGIGLSGYGLLPPETGNLSHAHDHERLAPDDDAPLTRNHLLLMGALVVALVIDVMKPASLGFVMPGMIGEYGVPKAQASLVPFAALIGTVTGSALWGVLADMYGRKASILLSAIVFVGTSICGAMPSLAWNIFMCFMMGAGAGGMLPVAYALLAEIVPARERSTVLVLVGGLGAVGGYFAASFLSTLLVPIFSWRILWLANLPTGLVLLFLNRFIPESPKFLLARRRDAEAFTIMRRFGIVARPAPAPAASTEAMLSSFFGLTAALSIAAIAWGLVNFGLLLWLPTALAERGFGVDVSSRLIAKSALIALPTVFVCAALYGRWSTKGALLAMVAVTMAGLAWTLSLWAGGGMSVLPVALLIVGSNGLLAILLPYTAESYPLAVRGRATGWIAACSKGGGVIAQSLSIMALVPPLGTVAMLILIPAGLAFGLILLFGHETHARSLE